MAQPAYMARLLKESLRLYAAALPDATPIQCMAWLTDRRLFVLRAWPFNKPNPRAVEIIDRAMYLVVHERMNPRDALEYAQRELRNVRLTRPPYRSFAPATQGY